MSNLTSTLTLKLVDDGLATKAKADADALKRLGAAEKDLKKFGSAGRSVSDINKRLDELAKHGERLDKFRAGAKNVHALGQASRKARGDLAATAKAMADLGESSDPKKLAAATRAHERALKRQAKAHNDFADAVRAQRAARGDALGGRGSSIAAAERRIAADTQAANAALRQQLALIGRINAKGAAERGLAGGMGGAGRAQLATIEANRRLRDGMSRAGRAGMPVVAAGGAAEAEAAAALRGMKRGGSRKGGGGHGDSVMGGVVGGLGLHHIGAMAAGLSAYEIAKEAVQAQAHQQHERVRQRASGMSAAEVRENQFHAADLSGQYRAFSQTEIMHGLRNARSIVGDFHEAQAVMDPMLKLRTVALGAHPEKREELEADFDKLIKGMEIKGVTQNMPKFISYMDGMAKAVNTFGDTLRPTDYYEMFKYGRQATQGLSEQYMNTVAPTIAQELGGSSGGVAHAAFFRAIVGGKMANNAAEALMHIGLLDKDDLIINKAGSVKGIKPGHRVKGADEAQSNPYQWVQDYLVPALEKHGLTSSERMQETIGHIFSNQVAAQLVSLFSTQQSRIEKDAHLVHGAEGLEAANRFQRDDPLVTRQAVKAQAENFWTAFGGEKFEARIEGGLAKGLARAVEAINETARRKAEGHDTMLAPKNLDKLNRLLGEPTYDVQALSNPAIEQARQEKQQREAIDQRRAELDAQKASREQALDKLENGSFVERMARRSIGQTPEGLRGEIAGIQAQRDALDQSVAARDKALSDFQDAKAAQQTVDSLRFNQRNAGQGIAPAGAWGLHGAAGMDQGAASYATQPTGPVTVPLPPRRPVEMGQGLQQLKDVKDILGGTTDGLNPTIAPKVDTTQIEGVTPKVDAAKEKFSELGSASARPTVDTSSISEAIGLVQQLATALGAIGPAAAGAKSQIANVQAPRRSANPGWMGAGDYTTA